MSFPLLKPALYRAQGTASLPDRPALLGGKCRCGYIFFPWQAYGCERCGRAGDALTPVALTGRGVVESSALVRLHASPDREAPFVVATVRLEEGPVVRALAACDQFAGGAGLVPGAPVVTELAEVRASGPAGDSADRALDLRFVRPT